MKCKDKEEQQMILFFVGGGGTRYRTAKQQADWEGEEGYGEERRGKVREKERESDGN